MESIIKDISLADFGRKECELAEVEMPGLMSCRQEFGPQKILKGSRVMGSLHMTIQTAVLIETMKELGADLRWCSCNIYSTQDHAAAAMVQANSAVVFAWKGENAQEYWDCTFRAMQWPNGQGPNIIIDDGGDATMMLLEGLKWETKFKATGELPDLSIYHTEDEVELFKLISQAIQKDSSTFTRLTSELKGVSEETTTGVARLYQLDLKGELICPFINVNDSVTKSKFDNIYGFIFFIYIYIYTYIFFFYSTVKIFL
jgi:adenosylhomocysteinase